LEKAGDKTLARLLDGALAYKLAAGSRVQSSALGRALTRASTFEGKVSIVGREVIEGVAPPGTVRSGARPVGAEPHTPGPAQ